MTFSSFQFFLHSQVHSGSGTCSRLAEFVHGLGGKRVVLFTDKGLTQAGITEKNQKAPGPDGQTGAIGRNIR